MAVINQDGGQHGSAQKVPGGLRDRLMRAVARWPMAQVVGTVCRDEALEQDSGKVEFRLSVRETSKTVCQRPIKVKALCHAHFSSVATEPTHSTLNRLGLWKED